jgi:amidase
MCALAHGTDIAGSIRYPAYVCGVAGLKPTPGRIPALNPSVERRFMGLQLFSSQGLLARRLEDVELGLRSMVRDGHMDPTWSDVRLDFDDDTRPVRVALVDRVPGADIAPEVSAALAQAADALENAGYSVEAASPPDLSQALDLWLTIVMTEVELWMMSAVDATNDPSIISSVRSMSACAPAREPYAYAKALAQRDVLQQEWFRFLDRYPIVLLPTSCRAPMPWDEDLQGVDPMRQLLLDQSTLIGPAAMSLPALNVPIGMSAGCPVGVQLLGAAFRERRLLVAGSILEQACGFPTLHGTRLLS